MKFGVHAGLWMARWSDEVRPILETVCELGYDGVEVSLLDMSDEKAKDLAVQIKAHGLGVTCSDGLSPKADITSPDPQIRQAGLEYLQWAIATTAIIGSNSLAGVIYGPWGVFDPAEKPQRIARSAEQLKQLHADLEKHNVTLGIEAINRFETDLINTSAEAVALAKACNSPRIGVLLDTFHLNIEEKNMGTAIESAKSYLTHFHVSDNDRGVPGSGHVPWREVRQSLEKINYDGWVVAEMFVRAGNPASADLNIWRDIEPDATEAARQALANLRDIFS